VALDSLPTRVPVRVAANPFENMHKMLLPRDVYPNSLGAALIACGEYVYAYYRPNGVQPFYVGKGRNARVLAHWKNAVKRKSTVKDSVRAHELEIQRILKRGKIPHISLLAYNLEESNESRHAVAERVLQDAFGIQSVLEKTPGGERLADRPAALLQKREDSAKRRPLSLEAVVARYSERPEIDREDLEGKASSWGASILLVGLSETYHSAYQSSQIREMARMYWNLRKFENTSLPGLKKGKSVLLAWTSKLSGAPVIVGAWRLRGSKATYHWASKRYSFPATDDIALRKEMLGLRLSGTGKNWQGPNIIQPATFVR